MSDIPEYLQPYVEVLGADDAFAFLLAFGGAPIYLAEHPKGRSTIAAVIGVSKARALAKRFGPGHLRVPTGKRWLAMHLKKSGESVNAIARRLHVTDSTVRGYLKTDDDRQLGLFS